MERQYVFMLQNGPDTDLAVKALRFRENEVQIYGSFILYPTCLVDFGSLILT
jgi:hypothetical protein